MKKTIIILALLAASITSNAYAQPIFTVAGKDVTYDTTGTFAGTTLVGNLGMLKKIGTVERTFGLVTADSVGLSVSFSDSVRCSFYFMPTQKNKIPTIADTVAAVLPAGTATYYHSQDGSGNVTIPYYKILDALTDLTKDWVKADVYVKIWKVAGLHTYGTSTTGKSAGTMNVITLRYE